MSQFRAFYASRRFDQRSEFRSAADMGSYHVIAATKKKLLPAKNAVAVDTPVAKGNAGILRWIDQPPRPKSTSSHLQTHQRSLAFRQGKSTGY
jgi:hypothetical protein